MLSISLDMLIKQNKYNLLLVEILLIITELSSQTTSQCSNNNCDIEAAVGKCLPRFSKAIDISCTLNGFSEDCSKEVPEGTISHMNCKLNYIDIHTPGSSISVCRNGKWNSPKKQCVPDCDQIVPDGNPTIVNGNSAKRGEFPWHVAIYRQKPEKPLKYICGGSIISVKVVISAAHCFTDGNTGKLYPVIEYSLAAGKYYSEWDAPQDELSVQKKKIIKIEIPDDKYLGVFSNFAADIAAVIVKNAFILTNFIKPVCVDWNLEYVKQQLINGTLGKVAGWGATVSENPTASVELKQLILPYIERRQCTKIVPRDFLPFVTLDKYCAGYANGSSVCGGDSGGGMVFPLRDEEKIRYYLQGIVSVSPFKDGSCDDNQLGVYTKVNDYITFIRTIEESNRLELDTAHRRRQDCVAPKIENGNFTVHNSNYTSGSLIIEFSVITIECDSGYEKSVNNFPVCIAGVWSNDVPKCVSANRIVLPASGNCPAPEIKNGKYEVLVNGQYNLGDPIPNFGIVNFTCTNDNYVLTTTYSSVYCINGLFSNNLPKCFYPKCPARFSSSIDVDCELNGVKQDCSKKVPAGTVATMACKSDEETFAGPITATCLDDSWDVPLKQCTSECEGSDIISEEFIEGCGEVPLSATKETGFVKRGDFPWHVGIYKKEQQKSINLICAGSIISEKIVLSAARCFTNLTTGNLYPISVFYVAAGKHNLIWNSPNDLGFVQKRKICKLNIPRNYDRFLSEGNLAVVVVDKPFEFSNVVKPICVDWNSEYTNQQIKDGALGLIASWRYDNVLLRYITVSVIEFTKCIITLKLKGFFSKDKYCAGSKNGSNICDFNTGSGMVFPQEIFEKKKYFLQGITSGLLLDTVFCNRNTIATITRVVDYNDFIRSVTSFKGRRYLLL